MADFTDAELWRSVEHTVRNVLLPAIDADDEWACAAAIQLIGLARHAATLTRPAVGVHDLMAVLEQLAPNPLVAAHWSGTLDPHEVEAAVGAILAAAVDDDGDDGEQIRIRLRPVVVDRLDADLAATAGLMPYFRGQIAAE